MKCTCEPGKNYCWNDKRQKTKMTAHKIFIRGIENSPPPKKIYINGRLNLYENSDIKLF